MFRDANAFNCDLSRWHVSNVQDMSVRLYAMGTRERFAAHLALTRCALFPRTSCKVGAVTHPPSPPPGRACSTARPRSTPI
eukprot:7385549-Prymnesium_polylepis.2